MNLSFPSEPDGLTIHIVSGTGSASTELGAFDQALIQAGIANFNLIYLSSIVPENSLIVNTRNHPRVQGKWGDRLYVVVAQERASTPNVEAWAGLGWVQEETGKGLFVEHHGSSESTVRRDISQSLETLMRARSEEKFGPIQMRIEGVRCKTHPVCALVVATFSTESW